ncbi:hypothetical protein [Azospirillum agricola]|uniref:hypothetical protein n=1 Tax=Azospirillum agricola TaxID=1720247 RepID=UPI0015C4CDAD|nr:hypothetical protein [Azospirillum agricola]
MPIERRARAAARCLPGWLSACQELMADDMVTAAESPLPDSVIGVVLRQQAIHSAGRPEKSFESLRKYFCCDRPYNRDRVGIANRSDDVNATENPERRSRGFEEKS